MEISEIMKKMERLGWAIALCMVAAWGGMRGKSTSTADSQPSSEGIRPVGSSSVSGVAPQRSRHPARVAPTSGDLQTKTLNALQKADPLARMSELLAILSGCDGNDIRETMAAWEKLKSSGLSLPAEESLLNFRAGQIDGSGLLGSHAGTEEDLASLSSQRGQFEGWLNVDPGAARNWLASLPPGRYRNELTISSIAAAAKEDPAGATRQVAALPEYLQASAGSQVALHLSETGSAQEVSDLLGEMDRAGGANNPAYFQSMFDTLVQSSASPELAAALVEDHLDQSYVPISSIGKVGAEMSRQDPAAALDWVAGLAGKNPDLSEGSAFAATVQSLTLGNLSKAEEWEEVHATEPGAASLRTALAQRRRLLENRGVEEE
jgi:hypothetical protein